MTFVELELREGTDEVSHLLPGGNGQLDQPLDHRVDVDEVQPLDLMGLQAVGTLHARQDSHYLLCQSTGRRGGRSVGGGVGGERGGRSGEEGRKGRGEEWGGGVGEERGEGRRVGRSGERGERSEEKKERSNEDEKGIKLIRVVVIW